MPFKTKRNGGRIVIVNLQKTRMDLHGNLVVHAKCDDVMSLVFKELGVSIDSSNLISLPEGRDLYVVKERFRPPPPPIAKTAPARVTKRVKVHDDEVTSKVEIEADSADQPIKQEEGCISSYQF